MIENLSTPQVLSESTINNSNMKFPIWVFILLAVLFVAGLVSLAYFFIYPKAGTNSVSNVKTVDTSVVETEEDPNMITIWSWNTAAKALTQLIPDFNKLYPDIKVNVIEIPYNEANSRFNTAMSTGVGFPDIMDVEGPVSAHYISNGFLLDITNYAAKYKNDYVAYKWAEVTRDDKVYGLPWDSAPVGMFYRKDLFSAAGIDPNSIKTWDDFIVEGKKITKAPNQYMTLMSKKSDVGDFFQTLLCQFGGSEYDVNGNLTFNSPEGIKTINLMKKILDSGVAADIGWWTPEFYAGIKNGQIATLTTGVWMGGQIETTAPDQSGKWGVMPIPATNIGGVRSAVRGGSNLSITTRSKKVEMAWKYIEFALANKESQLKMFRNFSIFPALKTVYPDTAFSLPSVYFGNQNISKLFIDIQNKMPLDYLHGSYPIEINQIISAEVILAINGNKTPEDALKDAEVKANAILKSGR